MKHIARQLLCLLLAVCLCAGMICVTTAASTEELPPVGSLARKVVDSCEYTLDLGSWSTVASEGAQAICRAFAQMMKGTIFTPPSPICSSR